jgi:hypothetical protein
MVGAFDNDKNATNFLEFEFLAVLVTIFVQELTAFQTSADV